ncbi:hypothetical protein GCM10008957_46510 [Deinococcus ruber]|uniref:CHAT domain-containing protein n=2 Tax=Deinococcus ruber TaxID=1848197 RepID=A0A918FCF4_9DEIO|nr:hypothetical protein GCM10008957_46510 [Deinococcus ruber]
MEAPKFGEDRTPAGQLIEILWNVLTQRIQQDETLLTRPNIEQLFLQLDHLISRQAALVAELQIYLPAMAGNAFVELSKERQALITMPQRYASLSERAQAVMQIPPPLASVLVAIRQEVERKSQPDGAFHAKVISLWELVFNDLADRLDRSAANMQKRLLGTTRLLIMTANTPNDPLWVEQETQAIRDALYAANNRESLELVYNAATTGEQILPLLDRSRPHILHLSCHGTPNSLTLVDPNGTETGTDYDAELLLEDLKLAGNLRLVVFMACESMAIAARAVEHVDAAIGMSEEVADEDAPEFSRAFYAALAANLPLQAAFDRARHAVRVRGGGYHIPQLFVRQGMDARELLFGVPG